MSTHITRYDGNDQEGLGSILQGQLHLYAFCKINGYKYGFPGFKNISHYQYTNETKNSFNNKLNNFFNLPSDDLCSEKNVYVDPSFLINSWGEENNQEKKTHISDLFNFINYDGINFFKKNKTNICVHIRNKNSEDVCFNVNRELYSDHKKKYFLNLINNVLNIHGTNCNILIFSQGKEDEFTEFLNIRNLRLFLNTDLLTTFYHLILGDILITSNSSLSWCAHLYNKNKYVYSRNNFFHSWYPSTFMVDLNGNLL